MKYAKVKDGNILHVIEVPFELDLKDHIPVNEDVEKEPGLYQAIDNKIVKKPQDQIDKILAKRKKKDRLTMLEEWARTMGYK